jgi:Flp pilus assembly protein TadD
MTAAEAIERVHGKKRKGFQTYAEAFHAARNETPDAAALLFEVTRDANVPAIARATAYAELGARLSPAMLDQFRKGLSDADPIVRIGALRGLEPLPAQARWPLAGSLLADPVRAVRIEAASFLAPVPATEVPGGDKQKFEAAAAEYIAAQRLNADRPESRTNLGNFFAGRGQAGEAETEYRAALHLEPRYVQAAVNLADLYRAQGREAEAETTLRQAMAVAPEDAAVQHALGLTLVRLQRPGEALELLGTAAERAPSQTRYAYVYGIALNSAGRVGDALDVLKENLARHPGDQATLAALISINREQGDVAAALHYAEELANVNPQTPGLAQVLQELRAGTGSPGSEPAKP